MSKYLKLFNDAASYEAWKTSEEYLLPNVSYTESGDLYYNAYIKPLVYNMVDLGLPSGTLWADRNVGAASPEDAGLYFAWGEAVGYTAEQIANGEHVFNEDTYKYVSNDNGKTYDKYNYDKTHYNKVYLEKQDDAATVNMGENWRIPTSEEFNELVEYTTFFVVDENNNEYEEFPDIDILYKGVKYVSKINGNSIFLPLNTGYFYDSYFTDGDYLQSNTLAGYDFLSCFVNIYSYSKYGHGYNSLMNVHNGCNVRGVYMKHLEYQPNKSNIIVKYDVLTTDECTIAGQYSSKYFASMFVDGVEMDVDVYIPFKTAGLHTVEFVLADNTQTGNGLLNNVCDCKILSVEFPSTINKVNDFSLSAHNGVELIFNSKIAPDFTYAFGEFSIPNSGVLKYPKGSDYSEIIALLPEGWTTKEF